MVKFKIGDRVEWLGDSETSFIKSQMNVGAAGTVKYVYGNMYAVEFDDAFMTNHICDGICKDKHGWWCNKNELRILKKKPKSREFKLIITSEDDKTTAKLIHGKKIEKEASVIRYHSDEYSEKTAVQAVCEKIFKKETPKETNFKAVFIGITLPWGGFTRGKIYEFVDGCVCDNNSLVYRAFDDPAFAEFVHKCFVKLEE